jgi:D-3-phosphoglycerate dehydrogenase
MSDSAARPVVLLTNAIHPEPHALLAARADVRIAPATDAETLIRCAAVAEVIVVRAPLPAEALAAAPLLRGLVRHGAGLDMIPIETASRLGVAVANVPGVNAVSVAEYVIGQMLALTHRLHRIDRTLRSEGWSTARALADQSIEATGRTVGIVGMGAIGVEVARICHEGLRMRVLGMRRSSAAMPAFVTAATLDELLAQSDVVVLACPLNDSTRGMVGADRLRRMKPGAFLVNVSRGPVVDEAALIAALRDGPLGGAALDVFEQQPLPASSPLFALPNVILSTHLAGITEDSMRRMGHSAVTQTLALLDGKLPEHFVNTDVAAAVRARLASLETP